MKISKSKVQKFTPFDYDASVRKMRGITMRWKNAAVKMLRGLYLAKGNITVRKGLSWSEYCADIGIPRQAADRWLRKFKPFELSGNAPSEAREVKTNKRGKKNEKIDRF